jgi:hypothetical protein
LTRDPKVMQSELRALAAAILAGRWGQALAPWRGADVVIAETTPPVQDGGFFPRPRTVVTPFSLELSWLFERLRDIFADVIDGTSKIEFYRRLANAANHYLEREVPHDRTPADLLLAVTHEAHAIRDQMEDGDFNFLVIAPGNAILDDLIERGEESGYLGPEATRRFFEDMEKSSREH